MLSTEERCALAARASYGGNPEHKRSPGDYGLIPPASPRPGKTLCDGTRNIPKEEATDLLVGGLLKGMCSQCNSETFPKNIWSVSENGEVFEAQLENQVEGIYHGYPVPNDDDFINVIQKEWMRR
jgi:hypothetical protein